MEYGNGGRKARVDAGVNVVNQAETTPQGRVVSLDGCVQGMPGMCPMGCMRFMH